MEFEDKRFVLGVGVPKAGTTWLYEYLSARSDIYMSPRKEMHYFDAKYRPDIFGPRKRHRLLDTERIGSSPPEHHPYREFFRTRVPANVDDFGEITPAYAIIGEQGFREIRGLFRNIRIILILRDPVERFYSQMRMQRNKRVAKDLPLHELEMLIDSPRFTELSRYEDIIPALEGTFRSEEIIYLFYETLFRAESIVGLCRLLELPYLPADFGSVVNSGGVADLIPEPLHRRFLEKFEPTYRFCHQKFGADLPAKWHLDDALACTSGEALRQANSPITTGFGTPALHPESATEDRNR